MDKIKSLFLLTLLFCNSGIFSQTTKTSEAQKNDKPVRDFILISSDNRSITLEYTPFYIGNTDFSNSIHHTNETGKPDLPSRNFPVITPSGRNNVVEIYDINFEEINNVTIKPIPSLKRSEKDHEIYYDYINDNAVYSTNKYMPETSASFINDGIVRNKYIGYININPIQYNPVTKTLRRIKNIKMRVIFGDNPLYINRSQSKNEIELFRDIAINWNNAINWSTAEFNNKHTLQNSVLANGDFYKIEIRETGIYRMDKTFLQQAGINVSNIDPRTIKIYGNGGAELPYNNSSPAPIDPVENAIYVEGESDGVFNDNDYILFYAQSPHQWMYSQSTGFYHSLNHYSNSNYYLLTFGGSNGRRMQTFNSSNITGLTPLPYFKEKFFEEPEVNNLGSTGLLWVSQRIGSGEGFVFNRELKGYISGTDIILTAMLENGSVKLDARYLIKDENSNLSVLLNPIPGLNDESFSHINPAKTDINYQLNSGMSSMNLKISLPQQLNNSSVSGYYDYLEIFYNRSFSSASGNYFRFTSPDTSGILEYRVSPFSSGNTKLFRIINYNTVDIINPISYSGGTIRFQNNAIQGQPIDYYIIGDMNYKTPASVSLKMQNQNLKGFSEGADYIIIAPTEFLSAAGRLKTIRESGGPGNPNYLKTLVVDINQIYNEFSGCVPDPVAMRNFLKYAFNIWQTKPVYVLFLGDGNYDYKNILGLSVKNYIPPIETTSPTMDEIDSYCSDDFITEINENYDAPHYGKTDFSCGRFCINSQNEANSIIDKIVEYESSLYNGIWKKKIMYCADDGWITNQRIPGSEGDMHTQQCENLAEDYTPGDYEKEKIYIVAYPTAITPLGRRKPGANIDIIKGWNEGRLLINWTGHGSTDLWAHEHVFVKSESIPQLHNKGKYPVVTIASCDLARWDDPYIISAAEELLFVNESGGIGIVAATRPVFSQQNEILNYKLWTNLAMTKDDFNMPLRIGKAFYNTKNQIPGGPADNDMKYVLLGDPALRFTMPQYFTRIDSINTTSNNDTAIVKALQKMTISGSILRSDSTFWNNFNGNIIVKVFDVERHISLVDFDKPFNFKIDGGTIFKGNTGVANGKWKLEFIVPKDISYNNGTGKILAYFYDSKNEGSGYSNMFKLMGLDTTAIADTTGPAISLFMDNRNFKIGDVVNQNSKIIADFYDENGINLTGAIGHNIESIINNDENNKINLTSFYNSTTNYKYGTLEYPLTGLADGFYTIKLRAWDTYNNFSEISTTFTVKNNQYLAINNVFNYPNPMTDVTTFTFQHNFDIPLSSQIDIYTIAGRKIKTLKRTNIAGKFVSIPWDGRDEDGDNIANGTYIYKVIVKSDDGSYSKVQTGKLVKLR
jgi:hypothetical protein